MRYYTQEAIRQDSTMPLPKGRVTQRTEILRLVCARQQQTLNEQDLASIMDEYGLADIDRDRIAADSSSMVEHLDSRVDVQDSDEDKSMSVQEMTPATQGSDPQRDAEDNEIRRRISALLNNDPVLIDIVTSVLGKGEKTGKVAQRLGLHRDTVRRIANRQAAKLRGDYVLREIMAN